MKANYVVNYADANGNLSTVEGETLADLARELEAVGYDGGSIRVTDEAGFVRGWVSAGNWRAQ